MKKLIECFESSPQGSVKHKNYFEVYESLFKNIDKSNPITLVEVGVLNGGSLFMWREFFGDKARIIGIDINPEAKKWESHGFEIFIGDQKKIEFWNKTLKKIGKFNIFIDDGGHTNVQQANTLKALINYVDFDCQIIFEDTHASFQKDFGNPSIFSFCNISKKIINYLHSNQQQNSFINKVKDKIFSIEFFDSIIVFNLKKNKKKSELLFNNAFHTDAEDLRHSNVLGYKILKKLIVSKRIRAWVKWFYYKIENIQLVSFFIKK